MYVGVVFDKKKREFKIGAFAESQDIAIHKLQMRNATKQDWDFLVFDYSQKDAGVQDMTNWLEGLGFKNEEILGIIGGIGDSIKKVMN